MRNIAEIPLELDFLGNLSNQVLINNEVSYDSAESARTRRGNLRSPGTNDGLY